MSQCYYEPVMIPQVFSTLLFALLLFVSSTGSAQAAYSVSGYVVDAKTGQGLPGYVNNSIYVYADNTATVYKSYIDSNGYWQINNLQDGHHSIEIANAGSIGFAPVGSEKVVVNGARNDIRFQVIRGYDVVGRVVDTRSGTGIPGLTIYADFPNRWAAETDQNGNYRLTNLTFGGNGHTIYVQTGSWQAVGSENQVVNPSGFTTEVRINFTVQSPTGEVPSPYASCNVYAQSISGSVSPVYIILGGSFTSNNTGIYYPQRYEWDFDGNGSTDSTSYTNSLSISSPQGVLTAVNNTATYRPKLKVYFANSIYPAECSTPTTVVVNPSYVYPPPFYGTPSCTLSAYPSTGIAPLYSTLTGTYSNGGDQNKFPISYSFFAVGGVHTINSGAYQAQLPLNFVNPGSFLTSLEVQYSGGTTSRCWGPTVTVNPAYSLHSSGGNSNSQVQGVSRSSVSYLASSLSSTSQPIIQGGATTYAVQSATEQQPLTTNYELKTNSGFGAILAQPAGNNGVARPVIQSGGTQEIANSTNKFFLFSLLNSILSVFAKQ